MSHLGDRLAAYIDGELPRGTREVVAAHLALCAACRAAAAEQAQIKQGLTSLGGPDPSASLLGALLDLAAPGQPMPPRRRPLGRSGPTPVAFRPHPPLIRPTSLSARSPRPRAYLPIHWRRARRPGRPLAAFSSSPDAPHRCDPPPCQRTPGTPIASTVDRETRPSRSLAVAGAFGITAVALASAYAGSAAPPSPEPTGGVATTFAVRGPAAGPHPDVAQLVAVDVGPAPGPAAAVTVPTVFYGHVYAVGR